MPEPARCRSCGAPLKWATTANGRAMPLDAEPSADGNLYEGADGVVHLATAKHPAPPGVALYRSHFSTCPDAAKHRKEARP